MLNAYLSDFVGLNISLVGSKTGETVIALPNKSTYNGLYVIVTDGGGNNFTGILLNDANISNYVTLGGNNNGRVELDYRPESSNQYLKLYQCTTSPTHTVNDATTTVFKF